MRWITWITPWIPLQPPSCSNFWQLPGCPGLEVKALQLSSSCLRHIVPLWKHHRLNKITLLIFFLFTAVNIASLCISCFFSCLSNKVSEVFLKCQQITVVCAFLVGAKSSPVFRQTSWLFKQKHVPLGLWSLPLLSHIPSQKLWYIYSLSHKAFLLLLSSARNLWLKALCKSKKFCFVHDTQCSSMRSDQRLHGGWIVSATSFTRAAAYQQLIRCYDRDMSPLKSHEGGNN